MHAPDQIEGSGVSCSVRQARILVKALRAAFSILFQEQIAANETRKSRRRQSLLTQMALSFRFSRVKSRGETVSSTIAEELRESVGYLRDAGWRNVARVVQQGAAELERQSERIAELERRLEQSTGRARLPVLSWRWAGGLSSAEQQAG